MSAQTKCERLKRNPRKRCTNAPQIQIKEKLWGRFARVHLWRHLMLASIVFLCISLSRKTDSGEGIVYCQLWQSTCRLEVWVRGDMYHCVFSLLQPDEKNIQSVWIFLNMSVNLRVLLFCCIHFHYRHSSSSGSQSITHITDRSPWWNSNRYCRKESCKQ